jgi:hypothetical protein
MEAPRSVKGLLCSMNGKIDIFLRCLADLGDQFARSFRDAVSTESSDMSLLTWVDHTVRRGIENKGRTIRVEPTHSIVVFFTP